MFHPSYRVKRINRQSIESFYNDDLFLDVLQNEKNGLITVRIELEPRNQEEFLKFLEGFYITQNPQS